MKWAIKQNEHNKKWYFFITDIESETGTVPTYAEISAAALEKGIPSENLISARQIERYFDKLADAKIIPLPLELELDPSFDSRLIIAPNKAKAELYIRKAKDNSQPVDKRLIVNMLNNSGIQNIDFKSLQEKINAFITAPDREIEILIAEGTLPSRGKNRTLVSHVTKLDDEAALELRKKLLHAVETAHEQANMLYDKEFPLSDAQSLSMVVKNDLLFEFSKMELGASGSDVYGITIPGLPGNDPFVRDLRNISQTNDELRAACNGVLLSMQTPDGLKIRIIPYKDATVKAVVSEDKMEAILVLESGKGAGSRLTLSRLSAALKEINLPAERYTDEQLQDAIQAARYTSAPVEFVVCRGTPPVAPHSYKFNWKVDFDHADTASVKRGMLLLEAVFLEEGEAGSDVFGNSIPIEQAQAVELPKTDRTVIVKKEAEKTIFTAAIPGELPKPVEMMQILNSKVLNYDVNKTTGDVAFAGDLVINGDIEEHRTVKVGGSLTVHGDAGASLVYTKHSLLMNGGIRGAGRGTLWAKNSISLDFAETARILAGGNLNINRYCFRCNVKTNGILSIIGDPGSFIGGNAHAACGMNIRNLGDYKTVRTIVSFGQDYLIKDKIELCEKEMQENLLELSRIETDLADPALSKERIQELREHKVLLLKCNSSLGLKIFKLKENFESHIKSEIRITGTAYPGVILESHGRYYEIREPLSHVVFTFDSKQGKIVCEPIEEDEPIE